MRTLNIVFMFLILAAFGFLSLQHSLPPQALDTNTELDQFSAHRALIHLQEITQEPHPTGSKAIKKVQSYLVEQLQLSGLTPTIQRQEVIRPHKKLTRLATIENIIAVKKGTAPTGKSLALMAHYDSREHSLGASDDGSGIVTILETLRALSHLPPLQNDLVIIFTDGEESGLFGAKAFVDNSPLANDIGVLLNFEARGTSGPVMMFETSNNNSALISALQSAVPYPRANTLAYAFYKKMPNDTDFTEVKNAGIPGLNFAFTDNYFDYHSMSDSSENINLDSLQHAGSYALSLSQYLGDQQLPLTADDDAIYFNTVANSMVSYSTFVSYIIAFFTVVILTLLLYKTAKLNKGHPSHLIPQKLGLLVLKYFALMGWVSLVIQAIYGFVGDSKNLEAESFFTILYGQSTLFWGFTLIAIGLFSAGIYAIKTGLSKRLLTIISLLTLFLCVLSFGWKTSTLVALAICTLLFSIKVKDQYSTFTLHLAGLVQWMVLVVVMLLVLPEGMHVFNWPLVLAIGMTYYYLYHQAKVKYSADSHLLDVTSTLGSVLAVYWLVALFQQIFGALGLSSPGVSIMLFGLIMVLVTPFTIRHVLWSKGVSVLALLVLGGILTSIVTVGSDFSERNKRPDSMFYLQDHSVTPNTNYWISSDDVLAKWSLPVFSHANNIATFEKDISHFKPLAKKGWWQAKAGNVEFSKPDFTVVNVESSVHSMERKVKVWLSSVDAREQLDLYFSEPHRIKSIALNGVTMSSYSADKYWLPIRYYGLPEQGVEFELTINGEAKIDFKVMAVKWGYTADVAAKIPKRPSDTMPKFYHYSDAVVLFNQTEL